MALTELGPTGARVAAGRLVIKQREPYARFLSIRLPRAGAVRRCPSSGCTDGQPAGLSRVDGTNRALASSVLRKQAHPFPGRTGLRWQRCASRRRVCWLDFDELRLSAANRLSPSPIGSSSGKRPCRSSASTRRPRIHPLGSVTDTVEEGRWCLTALLLVPKRAGAGAH